MQANEKNTAYQCMNDAQFTHKMKQCIGMDLPVLHWRQVFTQIRYWGHNDFAQHDYTKKNLERYFELNKDSLTSESEQSVLEKSECWQDNNVQLRLEGHCDERGTTEYNIALGQRRADAVARFLMTQGILDGNLKTVSHGEEKPAVQGSTEAAYQQNRRVEIIVQ